MARNLDVKDDGLARLAQSKEAGPCDVRHRCERYKLLNRAIGNPDLRKAERKKALAAYENCNVYEGKGCLDRAKLRGEQIK